MSAHDAQPDAVAEAVRITRPLEARDIAYAIGGAIAYGFWGVPRATVDVDLNLFVGQVELADAIAALRSAGVAVDEGAALASSRMRGDFHATIGPMRLDVFTPSIDFSWEAARTRVRVELLGQPIWILSAEATAVFKLLFFRPKDLVDLDRLVAVQREKLDAAYVRRWIVEMVGEDDPRVSRWEAIVASYAATAG